jgi:hypothetical protein
MKRPDFTDPYEAARVSTFMEAAQQGRWKLEPFTIDKARVQRDKAQAILTSDTQAEIDMKLQRLVPEGDYICLLRRMTDEERAEHEEHAHWENVPIMSDTPSEISEHAWVIDNAHGRVLVVGLGLGVVVSALLAKPDVEHITVVEIDRDVIALTGPYYEDEPRVTIVNDDALRFAAELDRVNASVHLPFDFAWHDIWSHISDRNLDDDLYAEHGISYQAMFEAYEPFAREQGAWAYAEARQMQQIKDVEHDAAIAEAKALIAADEDTRVEMLIDALIRKQAIGLTREMDIPSELRQFFQEQFDIETQAREVARNLDVAALERIINQPRSTPLARPNEVEEANVARG